MNQLKRRKLKIGIDVDGITADTLPYWLKRIFYKTKISAQVEDINQWDMAKCPPLDQIKDPQADIYDFLQTPDFTTEIPLMWGVQQAVQSLTDAGHEVYFVTARSGAVHITETFEWFRKRMKMVNTKKQLIFCSDKTLIPLDVLIDDKAETLVAYKAKYPRAYTIGISYPYNIHLADTVDHKIFGGTNYLDRTLVWGQILGYVEAIAETLDLEAELGDSDKRCCIP